MSATSKRNARRTLETIQNILHVKGWNPVLLYWTGYALLAETIVDPDGLPARLLKEEDVRVIWRKHLHPDVYVEHWVQYRANEKGSTIIDYSVSPDDEDGFDADISEALRIARQ